MIHDCGIAEVFLGNLPQAFACSVTSALLKRDAMKREEREIMNECAIAAAVGSVFCV